MPHNTTVILGSDLPEEVTREMMKEAEALTAKLIPALNESRIDIAAMVLSMLLGQNIAHVLKNSSEHTLETLVDRITLSVRTSAEASLADDDSNASHRSN